ELPPDAEAHICSSQCTFWPASAAALSAVCPDCGGELIRRPRRGTAETRTRCRRAEGHKDARVCWRPRRPLPRGGLKSWPLLPHDRDAVADLARRLSVAPVVAQLLLNRGLADDAARAFLESALTSLHAPELLPGVPAAVEHISAAVAAGRRVCVYG